MMAQRSNSNDLLGRLPTIRGRYTEQAALANITWFRVGGPAEVMFRPADVDDLAVFLAQRPADLAVTVLGVGSNILVRDGGIPGVVIRLGRGFNAVTRQDEALLAGAAVLSPNAALAALEARLTGLEFLSGVPGSIGGALRMNAGAFGGETKDVLVWAEALDERGRLHRLSPAEMGHTYRHSAVPEDWIFVRGLLQGAPGEEAAIRARMAEIQTQRESSQPLRTRTGGSTFKNPPGQKAWQLIDAAGCRGLRRGDAVVSEKHCNFLVNLGSATASDLEELGEEVRRRVQDTSGVTLEWEIRRLGIPGGAA